MFIILSVVVVVLSFTILKLILSVKKYKRMFREAQQRINNYPELIEGWVIINWRAIS